MIDSCEDIEIISVRYDYIALLVQFALHQKNIYRPQILLKFITSNFILNSFADKKKLPEQYSSCN